MICPTARSGDAGVSATVSGGRRLRLSVWALVALAMSVLACQPDPADKHLDKIPRLRPDVRDALSIADSDLREARLQELGASRLYAAWKNLDLYLTELSPDEFGEARNDLRPFIQRMGDGFDEVFDYRSIRTWAEMIDTLSVDLVEIRSWLEKARVRLNYAEHLDQRAIHDSLLIVLEVARGLGDPLYVPYIELDLAYRALDFDEELGWKHAREALRVAERMEEREVEYQTLGLIAFLHSTTGRRDSSLVYLNEGLARAVRTRHGLHATRLSLFLANWYEREGRFALAEDLRQQALRYSEELVAGPHGTRFFGEIMETWGDRECWEAVERYLPRARLSLRESEAVSKRPGYVQLLIDGAELRLRVARGELDRAEDLIATMERVLAEGDQMPARIRELMRAKLHDALLDLGRPEPVAAHLDTVLADPDVLNNHVSSARLGAQYARALLAMGRSAEALEVLARRPAWVNETEGGDFEVAALVVEALLVLDKEAAARELSAGLRQLLSTLEVSEPSPAGYFLLNSSDALRRQSHVLWGKGSRTSYELELAWQSLPSRIGSREGDGAGDGAKMGPPDSTSIGEVMRPPSAFMAAGRRAAAAVDEWADATGGVHYLYSFGSEGIWRWTNSHTGTRKDTLSITPGQLRSKVGEFLSVFDPAAPKDGRGWEGELRLLYECLLEGAEGAEVHVASGEETSTGRGRDSPVLWTVPDFLRQLPPGLLNVGTDQAYQPWLSRCELAVFRPAQSGATRQGRAAGGLMLVNPTVSPEISRRFPEVADLPFAEQEAEAAAAYDSDLVILRRADATKAGLLASWEDAGFLHLATHLVRRPENPYLTFVPLAGDSSPGRTDEVLEIIDVRRANLTSCETVVLSGCDTGAPVSIRDGAAAPTLAEAFLDAGAGAVVHTFWPVRDDTAARLVSSYLQHRAGGGIADVRALRRAQIEGWRERIHPNHWGAFGVQLSLRGLEDWRERTASDSTAGRHGG